MLISQIMNLKSYEEYKDKNFERIFRQNGLDISEGMPISFDMHTADSYITIDEILKNKDSFGSIFFEENSSQLLWILRCTSIKGKGILSHFNSYIDKVSKVVRGGLNIYKLNGWDVHILYVYQLINYNFKNNIIPTAYKWDYDIGPLFEKFNEIYNGLSANAKFVLNIGSFLHDIGVIDGVLGHEAKGIPHVENGYKELGITRESLDAADVTLLEDEIIALLKVIVGHHQIINQITAESSDRMIYENIMNIKESLSGSRDLIEIFSHDFIDIMVLLAAADLIGVDDRLLAPEKYEEIMDSREFLKQIVDTNNYARNKSNVAKKRLVALMPDNIKKESMEDFWVMLELNNEAEKDFTEFLYSVRSMSYAMTAIKPMNSLDCGIKLMIICRMIAKENNLDFKELVISFDPDIDTDALKRLLLSSDLNNIIKENHNFKYKIDKERVELMINCL